MATNTSATDLENLIAAQAKRLVNDLLKERRNDKPPFLPKEFAKLVQIKQIKSANLGGTSAVLLRFHDGYVIKVNEKHHPVKQNFSFAHEIGHILFDELGLGTYVKNIEYRTFNPQGSRRLRGKIVEHLCDCAAAELLMPESIFKKYLSGFGVSIYSVERLANSFQVSIQAAAIRIAEVSTEPCLVTKWQPEKRKPTNLRLAWCMGPEKKGKGYYEPIHVSVRPPSAIHNAYEGGSCVKSFRLFKIGDGVQRLLTESKGFGQGETRYVISLAFLDR